MEAEENLREIFLREFVRALIEQSKPAESIELDEKDITNLNLNEAIRQKSQMPPRIAPLRRQLRINPILPNIMQKPKNPIPRRIEMKKSILEEIPRPEEKPSIQIPEEVSEPEPQTKTIGNFRLENIREFLSDPNADSLECPGPEKPLLLSKRGKIDALGISLTPESITSIMQEISEQARIPLIPGVFKAILNNLLITAIISDFAGTRFIIQKTMPPQPQMIYNRGYS